MDIFSIFTLLGGLAFFLYGMNVMSSGLEKVAGGKLEQLLNKMTSNPLKSLVLGAGITIAIQSSSAMTVMLVGLVNSGIMQLGQTIGVIMGSNIGTTLTAWVLSAAGIESDVFILKMLKPSSFAPIVALVGIAMIMMSKKKRRKDVGHILVGFSVLMFGMSLMSDAVAPLADEPEFQNILTAFKNPFLGVLVGAVFTGIIQSSAASVGILQAFALTGNISFGMAIPIIMGQNIGTCVTSLISSIGVNRNAKRVAMLHILFNVIGTVFCLAIYYIVMIFIDNTILDTPVDSIGIAMVHSVFNIFTTIVLFPFSKKLVRVAELIIRDKNKGDIYTFLDDRLLNTPSFAISECNHMIAKMATIAKETFLYAIDLSNSYDDKTAKKIEKNEDELDMYEDKLGSFLVKLSSNDLSDHDSKEVSKFLHTIGDFERIGDHSLNMVKSIEELNEKKIAFSEEAKQELATIAAALTEIINTTTYAFETGDLLAASKVEPLEQVIDGLISEVKSRHITRLQNGDCTIVLGFVFSDVLSNYERVSDHCSNIAVALIEVAENSFDTHQYLNNVKKSNNEDFIKYYNEYKHKYRI